MNKNHKNDKDKSRKMDSSNSRTSNKKVSKKNSERSDSSVVSMNSEFTSQNFIHMKKLKRIFIVVIVIFVLLVIRIGFLDFVDGSFLKEKAYQQQAINQIISPKRGNIYDSTGKALAISAQVDTITINPTKIKDEKDDAEKTKLLKEKVAQKLAEIFSLDYQETLEKVNSNSQVQTIAKKVEKDKVDTLRSWMKENKITAGINIDEDSKRYYPYDNVLSQVLGFCGSDNQGLTGIEYKWDSVLTGTPGKIVSSKDGSQREIPNAEESYIPAEDGSDLMLTVDLNIQTIVEKYLKQACIDNKCERGGTCIVMNPKTGDILSMANYPDFNLNTPFTPNETLAVSYDKMSTQEKSDALNSMWKNKCVSDLYEPGSVFKVITASVALEEHITGTDVAGDFYCKGYEDVSGQKIKCWRAEPHGSLNLRGALENSCNPALMQLGKRIGTSTLYQYYHAFGLFDQTNIGLPGEANSLFTKQETVGPVELATMSFGQRLNITPLQMITAISSVANDGILVQPRMVKQVTNTDTGAVTSYDTTTVRQVISKETATQVKDMMKSVVEDGTGYRGAVTGYTVGGKTGTSEPTEANKEEGYVASYVAISPVEDTQVVILLCLYAPDRSTNNYQGGQIAGPVVSQMLTEILPYLGVPSNQTTSSSNNLITVPDVRNKTFAEAEKILKSAGFLVKSSTKADKNDTLVTDQMPKPGIALTKNSILLLYDSESSTRTSVTVPDLNGKTSAQATNALKALNLNVSIEGTGNVVSQEPAKDSKVEEGTVIKVTLKKGSKDTH